MAMTCDEKIMIKKYCSLKRSQEILVLKDQKCISVYEK